jgi:hypothetical protein
MRVAGDLETAAAEQVGTAYAGHVGVRPLGARAVVRDGAVICFLRLSPNGRPGPREEAAFEAEAGNALAKLSGRQVIALVEDSEPEVGLTAVVALLGRRLGPPAVLAWPAVGGSRRAATWKALFARAGKASERATELVGISKSLRRHPREPGDRDAVRRAGTPAGRRGHRCSLSRKGDVVMRSLWRSPLAPALFNLDHPARYVHWHFFQMSVANVVVIVLMIVVFVAAILIPFPGRGRRA